MDTHILWKLHLGQQANTRCLLINGNSIFTNVGGHYLSRIDLNTGKIIWKSKADGWGSALIHESSIYYLMRNKIIKIDIQSGETVQIDKKFNSSYLGYMFLANKYIITGGWRGYSDIFAFNIKSGDVKWELKVKNNKLQDISPPMKLGDFLYITNSTEKKIYQVNIESGKIDTFESCRSFNHHEFVNQGTLYCGNLMFIDREFLLITFDIYGRVYYRQLKELKGSLSSYRPVIKQDQIYIGIDNKFCCYDLKSDSISWQLPIPDNCGGTHYPILNLEVDSSNITVIGTSQGYFRILNSNGRIIYKPKQEKRISSEFIKVSKSDFIYCDRSNLKRFSISQ